MRLLLLFLLFVNTRQVEAKMPTGPNDILGRWTTLKKNLIIEIYQQNNQYKAKVIELHDHHNLTPAAQRLDEKNPNPGLRSRHIIGMNVLDGLVYNTADKRWEGGTIYNPGSGKEYSAVVELTEDGLLRVKGYWTLEWIGKTMLFQRVGVR